MDEPTNTYLAVVLFAEETQFYIVEATKIREKQSVGLKKFKAPFQPKNDEDFSWKKYYYIKYSCPDECEISHEHLSDEEFNGQVLMLGSNNFIYFQFQICTGNKDKFWISDSRAVLEAAIENGKVKKYNRKYIESSSEPESPKVNK